MEKLAYKPDFDEAVQRWDAFWAREIIDRPCTRVIAPKDGCEPGPSYPGLHNPEDDLLSYVRAYDRCAAATYFAGEAMPFFFPNFGPDVYAAFLGAELEFAPEQQTSWAVPFIQDWKTDAADIDRPHGYWWYAALDFAKNAREIAKGKFGIAVYDLHSNLDCLAAMRGPQSLCVDLLDSFEEVEAAHNRVRRTYSQIYDGLYHASGQAETGTTTWLPFYSRGKFNSIQCDFICMISPEMARRLVIPALEEESQFLDHCAYHLDGPGALVHLDDLLAIPTIHSIQWVPGAGAAPLIEWMDLLKKIQDCGKSLIISASPEEIRIFHKELRPEMVFYDTYVGSQAEADNLLKWLKDNT
jgi:hypothetical protein